ncbi:MAG TPA: WecB/TagA/CpsF family glycosyltransferase [Acidimicrobiales bacterium]|nr:WecB/TagA/CpsF family glycosyltransferase [Acidimicrobiales bacterium]
MRPATTRRDATPAVRGRRNQQPSPSTEPTSGPRRPAGSRERPKVAFLAWTPIGGRSAEIADALGGEAYCVRAPGLGAKHWAPLRYALGLGLTVAYLVRRRPRALIVTNPPLLPGLLGWAYARATGAALVLDTHPGGFGAQGDAVAGRLQAVHRWLARRAAASLVTTDHWQRVLEGWGARGLVFHESRPPWRVAPPRSPTGRPQVLFVGTFGGDEPMEEVLAAARRLPEVDLRITGDLARCPAPLRGSAPDNVTFTGFLVGDEYRRAVEEADLLVTLSTEPTSVMRAGYEAVWAQRPLIVSDWPGLAQVFPFAVQVSNDAEGIAVGVRRALEHHDRLRRCAGPALDLQTARVERMEQALRVLLGLRAEAVIDLRAAGGALAEPGADAPPTSVDPVRIVGLPVSLTTWSDLEDWAGRRLAARAAATVCTIAPYQAYLAATDASYRRCLENASAVLVDGSGLQLVFAAAGTRCSRLTGREVTRRLYEGNLLAGARVALVGGTPEASATVAAARPDWLRLDGSFAARPDDRSVEETARALARFGAEVVVVALGSPKMELWAEALSSRHAALYLSTGGAIDTVTGVRRHPPDWVQSARLEWAWRAGQDRTLLPRLARGVSALPALLLQAAAWRLGPRP